MSSAHPKPRAVPHQEPQTRIGKLAAQIARLEALEDRIEETKANVGSPDVPDNLSQEEFDAMMATVPKPQPLPDGRMRYAFFERIREELVDRRDALESALSIEEPQSLEDVATLTMLFRLAVDETLEASGQSENPTPFDRIRADAHERRVRRLGAVVARGLRKFSGSPLLDTRRYWSDSWEARPWEEELALAEAELGKKV